MCLNCNEIVESVKYSENAKDYQERKDNQDKINENIDKIEEAIEEISCLMDYQDKNELRYLRQVLTSLKRRLRIERGKHD